MTIEPTAESLVTALRANLLNELGNSAKGSQAASTQTTVDNVSSQIQSVQSESRDSTPPPGRGENLDIKA